MIFITTYKVRPHLTKEETAELMAVFAENGSVPGTTAHYVAADGSNGIVISESDDAEASYRSILPYAPWIEYNSKVYLTIDQAAPIILEALS